MIQKSPWGRNKEIDALAEFFSFCFAVGAAHDDAECLGVVFKEFLELGRTWAVLSIVGVWRVTNLSLFYFGEMYQLMPN